MNDKRYESEIKHAHTKHHIKCVFAIFMQVFVWISFVMFALLHISSIISISNTNNIDKHCVYKHNNMIGKLCLFCIFISIMMLVYKVLILLTHATEYYLYTECHYHICSTLYALTIYVYVCTITIWPMTRTNNYSETLYTI